MRNVTFLFFISNLMESLRSDEVSNRKQKKYYKYKNSVYMIFLIAEKLADEREIIRYSNDSYF